MNASRGEKMLLKLGISLQKNLNDLETKAVSSTVASAETALDEEKSDTLADAQLSFSFSEEPVAFEEPLNSGVEKQSEETTKANKQDFNEHQVDVLDTKMPERILEENELNAIDQSIVADETRTSLSYSPYDDDSIADPNFSDSDNSSSSSSCSSCTCSTCSSTSSSKASIQSMQNISAETINSEIENTTIQPKTRKRKAVPSKWRRNRCKYLRNSGKAYVTIKKQTIVPAKQMKQPCDITKCTHKCGSKFTEEERLDIFNNYWALANINKQRNYISNLMEELHPAYRYPRSVDGKLERNKNNAFYFMKDNTKIRVCKFFFAATLGISYRCIRTVISKRCDGIVEDDLRGKHKKHNTVTDEIKNGVRRHIESIPTIESHYTRAHSDKRFIEGSKTIAQLYRDYKNDCETAGSPFASLSMYRNIFNYEYNIAFFTPKKDQCQVCVAYQNSSEQEKKNQENEYTCHLENKALSRLEKENDKQKLSQLYQVACFDLQATLPTPRGEVSSFYYRSKLSCYNFTVCDLLPKGQGPVSCFMWHEGEGKRGAIEIGSCLLKYLEEKASATASNDLEITFYSDNCCGQQKNKFIIAAYLYAVANFQIKSITHKFLLTGHTQNEGDAAHSLIEKNIKRALKSGPIYVPEQYVTLVRTAKKTGSAFKVQELSHQDFYDLKKLTEQTSVNFNKNNEGETFKFSDAVVFKVEKQHLDSFFYKMSFKETDYKRVDVTQRSRRTRSSLLSFQNFQIPHAYNNSLPIQKKKYDDLLSLINNKTVPQNYSYFYTALRVDQSNNVNSVD